LIEIVEVTIKVNRHARGERMTQDERVDIAELFTLLAPEGAGAGE